MRWERHENQELSGGDGCGTGLRVLQIKNCPQRCPYVRWASQSKLFDNEAGVKMKTAGPTKGATALITGSRFVEDKSGSVDVEGNCVDDEGTCGAALPTKEERCQGRDDVVVLVSNVSDLVDRLKPYVIHR